MGLRKSDTVRMVARMEYAAYLRALGLTYDSISNRLGVSRERVRQIIAKHNRFKINKTGRTIFDAIYSYPGLNNVRIANCIDNAFNSKELTPEFMAKLTPAKLLKLKNFGHSCLYDLSKILQKAGVVKNAKSWRGD